MKRLLMNVVVGLMLASLVLTACGSKATPTPTSAPVPTATPVPTAVPMIKAIVAMDATWPPFESIDEATKDIVGFDVDLMKAIAEKGGFEVEFVNVSWDPLLAGMAQCQYDAAISAMTITEERKKSFMFSEPYFSAGQIVTVGVDNADIKSKDDLVGKTVGAQLGTTGAIETEKMSGVTLKTYDDIGLAFQDLINNQIDAVVADNPLALGYVGENPDKLKVVGEAFTDEFYGIAVCKDKADLLAKINAGLAAVKAEGVIDELVTKWISGSGQ